MEAPHGARVYAGLEGLLHPIPEWLKQKNNVKNFSVNRSRALPGSHIGSAQKEKL
jgi:hypothetical protein